MARDLPILREGAPAARGDAARRGDSPSETEHATASRKLLSLSAGLAPRVKEGLLVAFSGGLDSAFLLWAATQAANGGAGRVMALTTTSPSTPAGDREDAHAFSHLLGVRHVWRQSREMEHPEYVRNDRRRCFHCKTELFRIAGEVCDEEDLRWIAYGYNASDRGDDRPGHQAALEAGVLAPLAEAGLTKREIRLLMDNLGLPLAGKAASPCLSSRITTGIEVTRARLGDVEAIESILREAGVGTLRVRVCRDEHGSTFLRVEVAEEEMALALECREALHRAGIGRGYRWVTLDLGGYRTGGGVS